MRITTLLIVVMLALPGLRDRAGARTRRARPAPAAPTAPPRDTWVTLSPGVRHLHRVTDEPLSAHVIVVDLRTPGVTVEVTPHGQRWRTPSQYGRSQGAVAAINGGFWSVFDSRAEGLVMHGGARWPGAQDDEFYGFFAVGKDGRALVSRPADVVERVGHLREAISGLQLLLDGGKVDAQAQCDDGCKYRNPRTAVGVDREGHRVFLAVVDGRQAHSRGISLPNLARLLAELGAHRAINLDGGGSAALYLATAGGLASRPADRKERDVLNHLGVFWRPTPEQLRALEAERQRALEAARVADASALAAASTPRPGAPVLTAPPRPSDQGVPTGLRRWFQLHGRELASPRNLLVLAAVLLAALALALLLVRRRRRAAPTASSPGSAG
jgi:hypothetical protein